MTRFYSILRCEFSMPSRMNTDDPNPDNTCDAPAKFSVEGLEFDTPFLLCEKHFWEQAKAYKGDFTIDWIDYNFKEKINDTEESRKN